MPFIPMHLHPPAIHENVNKLAHNERPSQVVTHVRESGVRSLYKAKASLSEALGVHSSKPVGPNLGLPSDAPTKTVYHSVESPLSEANASQATSDIARAKTLVNDLADVVNKVNSLSESSKFPQITNAKEKISVLKSLLNELQEVQTQLDIITSEKNEIQPFQGGRLILPLEEGAVIKIKSRTPHTPFTKNRPDSSEKMPRDNSTTEHLKNFLSCW